MIEGLRTTPKEAMPMRDPLSLLLVGPFDRHDRFVGGATVSFRDFVRHVEARHIPHEVVDTRQYPQSTIASFGYVLWRTLLRAGRHDVVMLHASHRGMLYVGPCVALLCRLFRRQFVLRPFGGDLMDLYQRAPAWHQALLRRTILRADPLFVETRALDEAVRPVAMRAVRFPNCRPKASREAARYSRRFAFVSRISEDKGVRIIADALRQLDASFTVHFFGPVAEPGLLNVMGDRYRGALDPHDVIERLREYDVLLLPTFFEQEGHPGVIVEAFSLGMPVVATRWRSLPELVTNGSGILIEPHSPQALAEAMQSIDSAGYERLCDGAREAFAPHDSDTVNDAALDAIFNSR